GKYTAATDAARGALERFPGWPVLPFRPVDLYGPNAADYAADLKRLADVRATHPDDAVLLFLTGHFLWFEGKQDEARALFRRVVLSFPPAARFLRPGLPAVL